MQAVGAAAGRREEHTSSVLALPDGGIDIRDFSSDNSEEEIGAEGWQDDDPIRSKVGTLLAKYGRMEGVQASSWSTTAPKTQPQIDKKCEPHNFTKNNELPSNLRDDTHVTFTRDGSRAGGFEEEDYVIIGTMDVHDTSTETSVEPQSASEGAHSISDTNDDSFEDLEWDGDVMMASIVTQNTEMEADDEADNVILMNELRAAVASSLASVDVEREGKKSPPPSRSPPFGENHHYTTSSATQSKNSVSQGEDTFCLDGEKERSVDYEFHSYASNNALARIGRYPRMFPVQDDECSDSLSVITELTEPDNESGRLSSRSSTPTDSQRSYSRSSTPIQKPRSSTPSTIEELDTEDEILSRPPTGYKDSKETSEHTHIIEAVKTSKTGIFIPNMEVDCFENNSPLSDCVESDHSFSQTSECSATESAQESHPPPDQHGSNKLLLDERRDSFDILAECSLHVSSAIDFADVYETNRKYVDATECDSNDSDILNNTQSPGRTKPEKPQRNKIPAKGNAKVNSKRTVEIKKKTLGNLAKEASEVVKRVKKVEEEDVAKGSVEMRKEKTDILKVGQVEMSKKKSDIENSLENTVEGKETKMEYEIAKLAESYKEIRKGLTHVERNEDINETKGKRRKMSDGVVVDSTPTASLHKLTKMFDVVPPYMRAGSPRPSDSDRRVTSSSNSSGEQRIEAGEEEALNPRFSVAPIGDQIVVMRRGHRNRECFVMDTEDAGLINDQIKLDSGETISCSDTQKVDTEHMESLNTISSPSHSFLQ